MASSPVNGSILVRMDFYIDASRVVRNSALAAYGVNKGIIPKGKSHLHFPADDEALFMGVTEALEVESDHLDFLGLARRDEWLDFATQGMSAYDKATDPGMLERLAEIKAWLADAGSCQEIVVSGAESGKAMKVGSHPNFTGLLKAMDLELCGNAILFGVRGDATVDGKYFKRTGHARRAKPKVILASADTRKLITEYDCDGERFLSIHYQREERIVPSSSELKTVAKYFSGPYCLLKVGQIGCLGNFGVIVYDGVDPVYQYGIELVEGGRHHWLGNYSRKVATLLRKDYGIDHDRLAYAVKPKTGPAEIVEIGGRSKIISVMTS